MAAAELSFHRERFAAAGFDPAGFTSLGDLAAVPLMRKADVLAAQRASGALGAGIERLGPTPGRIVTMSSGTSGTSFLRWPREWREIQGASSLRAHWWVGLRPGTPFLLVAPGWHVYAAVQSYIVEQLGLPGVVVSGTYLPRFSDRILEAVRRFRPRFLILFLPMVFSLLAEGRRQGLAAADVFGSVERLVVTGAPITAGMREHLRATTGVAHVIELAGSSENLLAAECGAAPGLHVVPDTCHVEVLTLCEARPGRRRRGRVVHTTMVPWGSMYIRYDGGDIGTLDTRPAPAGFRRPGSRSSAGPSTSSSWPAGAGCPTTCRRPSRRSGPSLPAPSSPSPPKASPPAGSGCSSRSPRTDRPPPRGGARPAPAGPVRRGGRDAIPPQPALMMKGVTPVVSEREIR